MAFQYLKGSYRKEGDRLFCRVFKLKEGRFSLDIRKKSFIVRVVRHWKRLPREGVGAPSLETTKVQVDGPQRYLIYLWVSLFTAGGLNWVTSKGPFQL